MLFLTEEDVERLLTMKDAICEVEAALRAMGEGKADVRPRQRVPMPHATLNVMAAAWPDRGYYGFKFYSWSREGARFWFHLFDGKTGSLLATMQANRLGQQRTGAATAVATEYLARKDAAMVGIVGTGWQAESQLEGVLVVRTISSIRCFSPDRGRREAFARKMSSGLGVQVHAAASAQEAVREADVVITATTSREPVLQGRHLKLGAHINAVGANRLDRRELDDEAVNRCTFIATDSREQAQAEAGDLSIPVSHSLLRWDWVHELGEVVAGKVKGRSQGDDITLFKSLGIALEDVAVGAFVFERAQKEGFGREIPL